MKLARIIKRIIMWVLIIGGLLVMSSYLYLYLYVRLSNPTVSGPKPPPLPQIESHELTFTDYADTRELVGSSHNVFVAKIIRKIGNEPRYGDPETQFEARAIYNIKGNLQGLIMVRDYLNAHGLQLGITYILATRGSPENEYTLNADGVLSSVLNANPNLTDSQIERLAQDSARVQELLIGYVYEILEEGDVRANIAQNSFQSLSQEEKNVVLSKVKNLPLAPFSLPREDTKEFCSDKIDNDHDRRIDLADSDCAAFLPLPIPENTKALCSDGIDNDRDGRTDLRDSNCVAFVGRENTKEFCSDGLDNDLDGYRDLGDSDCALFSPSYKPPFFIPLPLPRSVPTSTNPMSPTSATSSPVASPPGSR